MTLIQHRGQFTGFTTIEDPTALDEFDRVIEEQHALAVVAATLRTLPAPLRERLTRSFRLHSDGLSWEEVAKAMSVSRKTLQRDRDELRSAFIEAATSHVPTLARQYDLLNKEEKLENSKPNNTESHRRLGGP